MRQCGLLKHVYLSGKILLKIGYNVLLLSQIFMNLLSAMIYKGNFQTFCVEILPTKWIVPRDPKVLNMESNRLLRFRVLQQSVSMVPA